MSIQKTSRDEDRSQITSAPTQLPLTSKNLANHDNTMPAVHPSSFRMQRWLADASNTHASNATRGATNEWDQLKEIDEVATDTERAIGGGGA